MQHYHALDIRVLTVTESTVVEAPLWKQRHSKRRSREDHRRWASMLVYIKSTLMICLRLNVSSKLFIDFARGLLHSHSHCSKGENFAANRMIMPICTFLCQREHLIIIVCMKELYAHFTNKTHRVQHFIVKIGAL